MTLDTLRNNIARDLREIRLLSESLFDAAVNHEELHPGGTDVTGGTAMVMLAPSADPEAWSYRQLSAALGRTDSHGDYESHVDPTPPLLVLSTWEDTLRKERGQPTGLTATIDRAADYILGSLDWAFTDTGAGINFVAVDEMADALRNVRARLEGVLHAGERDDKGAPCLTHGQPYVKRWAGYRLPDGTVQRRDQRAGVRPDVEVVDLGESEDRWYCKGDADENGGHWATEDEYKIAAKATWRAYSEWLSSTDMEIQYRVRPALVVLWAHRGKVRKKKDARSGRVLYNVSDTRGLRDCETV